MEGYREVQSPFKSRTPLESSDIQSESESVGHDAHHTLGPPIGRIPGAFHEPVTIPPISSLMITSVTPPHVVRNNITAVSLTAAGMRPLVIEVGQYAPPSPTPANLTPRVSIHIKFSLSFLHDVSGPPALHGFSGTVTFAAPSNNVAQCVTREFAGGVCESVEYAYFEPAASLSPLSMSPVACHYRNRSYHIVGGET
jgi:hypothetical protein